MPAGEPGRATGIVTSEGERIDARHFIASGLNPAADLPRPD